MAGVSAAEVKARARELGFDLCGIAPVDGFPELGILREWLERGYAGEMAYMARSAERRRDARAVVPGARSVIVTGTLYNTDRPYSTDLHDASVAQVARYAWGDDYHDVLKARLEALLAWMRAREPRPFDARAYVDTGPVQERVYAQYAGLGWIGKNTCLINAEIGSWLFLAEIICTLSLEPDAEGLEQCGSCTRCLEACPTGALVEPGMLDSTRCLSYLTIELRGTLPEERRAALADHVYGCDICQEVCPYNQPAPLADDAAWQPRRSRRAAAGRVVAPVRRRSPAADQGQRDDAGEARGPAAQPRRGAWQRRSRRRGGARRAGGRASVARRSCGARTHGVGASARRSPRGMIRVMAAASTPLLLLSMPQMADPNFAQAVVLLCDYTEEGAFGLVVNHQMEEPAWTLVQTRPEVRVDPNLRLWIGGPVDPQRAWVLMADALGPDDEQREVVPGVRLSVSHEVALTVLQSPPSGRARVVVGYAGWGPGQLDEEIAASSWLTTDIAPELIFDLPPDAMWETAIKRLGADPAAFQSGQSASGVH